ncbi:pyridoxal phosphate-dependent aminotransferase [Streptacidiphilus sp. P02-A3a]|uniref:pyridoxal phosphate-dependent aminotransferase n=1 Tax=Streptacidiphilus sp. P02-A3a TaxID=2704468 RepID=UPI0015FB905F|nr:pyridoxal phosphate-dependent aminotransferase [Streptacidiphilus sp. P02-A3a]QMU69983.1 pyridoxal phosphate-dependent aminotransferase [Streptacidiphilus sp. P02-A3a]
MQTANRLKGLEQSPIRAMTQRCEAVGGINLGQGLCRVPPSVELLEAAAHDFPSIDHSYSYAEGDAGFRADIADKILRYQGLDVDPSRQIVATVGATGAFNAVLSAFLNPGDGVLVLEPFYGYHVACLRFFGIVPQPVRLEAPAFTVEREALQAAVTARTRAIVICTPGNPSGRRFTTEELEVVVAVAEEHDLLIITDEIYEHIYFSPGRHISPATIPGAAERTVLISGLSKTYSIPGWRLGYAVASPDLSRSIRGAADALTVCAPTPLQQAARHALRFPESYYENLRDLYDGKRALLTAAFEAAGAKVGKPEGAYYLFVDCSGLGARSGHEAAELLLEKAKVATIPGEAFYLDDPGIPYVRACFSHPDDLLREAAQQLREGLAS